MTVVYNDLDAGRDPEVDERVFSSRGGLRQTFPVTTESPGVSPQTKPADVGSFICGFSQAGSRLTSSICRIKSNTNLRNPFSTVFAVLSCALRMMVTFVLEQMSFLG